MFTLEGPWPSLKNRTVIPNPLFSNSDANQHQVIAKRAETGKVRTYVRRNNRRRLIWNFQMDREKALELRAFFKAYAADQILITDHNGEKWLGYFTSSPFSFEARNRALPGPDEIRRVAQERETISLEFQGQRRQ